MLGKLTAKSTDFTSLENFHIAMLYSVHVRILGLNLATRYFLESL